MASPITRDSAEDLPTPQDQGADEEERSFVDVYLEYKSILTAYAAKRGASDPDGVADLALFDGYRAFDRMTNRSEGARSNYLHRAAAGYVYADLRQNVPVPAELDEDAVTLDDPTAAAVDRQWLRELVHDLPPDQRAVIEHKFFDGLSGTETGAALGKDPNAVYQLQHRALKRLRRTILAGVLTAALIVLGVMVIRQATSSVTKVDSTPVDQTPEQSEVVEEPDRTADDDTDDVGLQPPPPAGDEARAGIAAVEAEPSGAAPSSTALAPPQTSTEAEQSTSTTTTAPVSSTSITPSTTTPPTPAPIAPATPLNACAPQQLSPTLSAFKFFNPANNADAAAAFNPPPAVRFLDGQGQVVHRTDTSGPMSTGRTAGAHGWIGVGGSGTFAVFDDAPPPRYWGVLAASTDTDGWRSIQTLDPATNNWTTIQACSN